MNVVERKIAESVDLKLDAKVERSRKNKEYETMAHRDRKGVDNFRRTGRRLVRRRPLLYVLCTHVDTLGPKGRKLYHARVQIS